MAKDTCACKEGECLCPVRGIIDVVSKKWTICIVNHLAKGGPMRYNEIKNTIGSISPKTLSDTLKMLEKEHLINRKVYPETPPRVEYSLTKNGTSLQTALAPLLQWIKENT